MKRQKETNRQTNKQTNKKQAQPLVEKSINKYKCKEKLLPMKKKERKNK